jgi:hypothetical protein
MQPTIWYEAWLDRPAALRAHALPARAGDTPWDGGIRRRLGRVLIDAGQLLAAEPQAPPVVRSVR